MVRYLVCPRCASTDVLPHKELKHHIKEGEPFSATYVKHYCGSCGYEGILFYEVPRQHLEKVQKEIRAQKKK